MIPFGIQRKYFGIGFRFVRQEGKTQMVAKVCTGYGQDVSNQKRVKDQQGRYYCHPCWAHKGAPTQPIKAAHAPPRSDQADEAPSTPEIAANGSIGGTSENAGEASGAWIATLPGRSIRAICNTPKAIGQMRAAARERRRIAGDGGEKRYRMLRPASSRSNSLMLWPVLAGELGAVLRMRQMQRGQG